MPIVENHPCINVPEDNTVLWRYMDIPPFLSLLTSSSLAFIRADLCQFDGRLPLKTLNKIQSDIDRFVPKGQRLDYNEVENLYKKMTYISCWCKENHHMVHMWKIYSKEQGIAIETTYEKLKNSIQYEEKIIPTVIDYIDRKNSEVDWQSNALTAFTMKGQEYKSEQEFRLIINSPKFIRNQVQNSGLGNDPKLIDVFNQNSVIPCKINLHELILKIHISPYAPKWYIEFITDITKKYGLENVSIEQAEL